MSGEPAKKLTGENYLWLEKFHKALQQNLKRDEFEALKNIFSPKQTKEGVFCFELPTEEYKNLIEAEFTHHIKNAFQAVFGNVPRFEFIVKPSEDVSPPLSKTEQIKPQKMLFAQEKSTKYSYANFIVTSSSKSILAALQQVCISPGQMYNPLFIWGKTGTGKTHLLKATQDQMYKLHRGNVKTIYIGVDEFVTKFLVYMKDFKLKESFRDKFRQAQVILFDDFHLLSGKKSCQEEFLRIFNEYYNQDKQIIIASKCPPEEIEGDYKEEISSKIRKGLVIKILPPSQQEQILILKNKANQLGREIPDEVLKFIVNSLSTTDVRRIEGALLNLVALSSLSGQELNLDFAKENLDVHGVYETKFQTTLGQIAKAVCRYYKIDLQDLKSSSRTKSLAQTRHMFVYIAKNFSACSFSEIAKYIQKKSKSVIANSIARIEKLLQTNKSIKEDYENILKMLLE